MPHTKNRARRHKLRKHLHKQLSPLQLERLFGHVESTIREVDRDNDRIQRQTLWVSIAGVAIAVAAIIWAAVD